ncbi:MAG: type II secretion system protein [Phycisphaerae bacterium]|nr:type II secretion system protein [Phycisphaerae bacterium]
MALSSRTSRGFTLIEVLIVVVILGILAAVVVPQFSDASSDAKLDALQSNLNTIRSQLQLYKMQHNGSWPALATFTNQMTLVSKADGSTAALGTAGYPYGPYLLSIPNNPFTDTNTVTNGADDTSAWHYNASTGEFRANDSDHKSL